MNGKRKYELIISTIFLIGAILCGISERDRVSQKT